MTPGATTAFLRTTLWIVFVISLGGVAFSGTLTYQEMAGNAASCPAPGAPGTIFGYPACVYGLAMYALLAILSGSALVHTSPRRALIR